MKALEKDRDAALRDGQRLRRRRAALPGRRAGAGVPAVGGVSVPQVRPAKPVACRPHHRLRAGAPGDGPGRRRTLVGGVVGTTWQAVRAGQGPPGGGSPCHEGRAGQAQSRGRGKAGTGNRRRTTLASSAGSSSRTCCAPPARRAARRAEDVEITVKRACLAAAGRIAGRFDGRPRAEAVARHDLGGCRSGIWANSPPREEQLRAALDLRRRTLPADDPATLNTLNSLAVLLVGSGKAGEGPSRSTTKQWRRRTAVLGPDHPHTLATIGQPGQRVPHRESAARGPPVVQGSRRPDDGDARPRPRGHAHRPETTWPSRTSTPARHDEAVATPAKKSVATAKKVLPVPPTRTPSPGCTIWPSPTGKPARSIGRFR